VKYDKMIEQVIFSWMNKIFITKQINKKEFNWKNIKSLIKKSGYANINKDEIQNIISKFKGNINLEKTKMYNETINEILRISKDIKMESGSIIDGRIDSSIKEIPFLNKLKEELLKINPEWSVEITPPRASCDIMVNSIRINLKLTNCKSADNSVNNPSFFYSITGNSTYPYSSTWNDFIERLQKNKIKTLRDKATEYHYLVKNKITGDVLLKSIFDIHTYISNPSNDLQINWKNEFKNITYYTSNEEYNMKVKSLIECIQKSVKDMIEKNRKFAECDINTLFN
jgi:hypothetical protein